MMVAALTRADLAQAGAVAGMCLVAAAGAYAQTPDSTAPRQAADPEPVVIWGGEVATATQYVWRGFRYSEGAVVWPSVWIAARGLTASLFFNYDRDSNPRWNEYDLELTYERSVGRLTLTGGYARYTYYDADSKGFTTELIGRTDFSVGPGRAFTTHALDVAKYSGSYYLEAGYGYERDIGARSAISADASIAFWSTFIDRYTRDAATHIVDGTVGPLMLTVSFRHQVAPGLAFRPSLSFVRIGDAMARRLLDPPGVTASLAIVVGR